MAQISLRSVTRRYTDEAFSVTVLDRADLTVGAGTFAVVCGPSGSGKSTLLNLIGALDCADSGTICVSDTDLASLLTRQLARFRNRTIGFVFQSFHLLPVLTATENVAWPLCFQGVRRRERMSKAREKLALVGLSDHADRIPGRLSGGQRQRVAIARALVCDPAVILADEPTANLDRRTAEEIIGLLRDISICQGVTLLCATHDPLLMEHAGQVIMLSEGKLAMRNAPQPEKASHV